MKPFVFIFTTVFVVNVMASKIAVNPPTPKESIGFGDIDQTQKVQLAQLTEQTLFSGDKRDQCLQRSLCAMGVVSDETWPKHSLGQGLDQFHDTLKKIATDLGAFMEDFTDQFPKIDQALGKYVFLIFLKVLNYQFVKSGNFYSMINNK